MADVLNTWEGGSNSLATSLTVALTGQTAGNLIAGCFFYTDNSEPPTPAGYTSIAWGSIGGGTQKGFKLFWKVATGTDDAAFDWTIEGSKLASCVIQEFDLQSAVLDDFFLDETNEDTSAKPMPCGTATPVAATSLAVAFLGVRNNAAGWPHGTTTAPTGYDDLQAYGASNASRPTTAMASKAVSGTADESPEFSTTDTGSRGYGGIAIFSGGVASNTLGITTEPEEWQQRNATTRNATASVAGTWTGTIPASIQWRAINSVSLTEIVTWNSVGMDAPDGGGTWSGDVTIDDDVTAAGEAITLQFRYSDDTGVTAESAVDWRIVRFVDILGQSNASRWGDRGTALTPDDDAWQYTLSGYAALSTTGDGNTQLANTLIAADGVPTVIRNYAVGGRGLHPSSDSTRWLSTAGGSPWKLFETGFTNSVAASEALVWVQGERDGQPTHTSYADYLAGLGTLFTRYRAALSNGSGEAQIPIVIGYIGNNSAGAGNHDEWADIRRAQQDYVASDANCYGMAYYDLSMEDSIHLDAAGFADLAERCANIFKHLNGDATYSAMPVVASATATALDTIDLAITHDGGTDFTPTTAITDFEVSDDDWVTDISLSSAVRLDANTIRLTLSRDYVGSFKVRYNYGAVYSVTGPVQDNSALTLPLDYVDDMIGFGDIDIDTGLVAMSVSTQPAGVSIGSYVDAVLEGLSLQVSSAGVSLGSDVDPAIETLVLQALGAQVSTGTAIGSVLESLSLSTSGSTVSVGAAIAAQIGQLTLSTSSAEVSLGHVVAAALEALSVTAEPATVSFGAGIDAAVEGLLLASLDASIVLGVDVGASLEGLSLVTPGASIELGPVISGGLENLVLTAHSASIDLGVTVDSTFEALSVTTLAAQLGFGSDVGALIEAMTLTEFGAEVELNQVVDVTLNALVLSTLDASVVGAGSVFLNPGLEFTAPNSKFHFSVPVNKLRLNLKRG